MSSTTVTRRSLLLAASGLGSAAVLTACGGNLGSSSEGGEAGAEFPTGAVTMLIGGNPGGSADLILRAMSDPLSQELGVPVLVENRPGANGAVAAQELAGDAADGQTIMIFNGTLAYITPLAVPESDVVDIDDYEVITGVSRDDYVLLASPDSGFTTIDDLRAADRPVSYGTTGVGTGSQLSSAYVLQLAGLEGTAVPFDGGSPTLTAVLGSQVDLAVVQISESISQIESGQVTPLVVMSAERNPSLPDVPTATESGIDAVVTQSRAMVAPKGTPQAVLDRLSAAFVAVWADATYQSFNADNQLVPYEVDGAEVVSEWTESLEEYRTFVEESGLDFGAE
ncbi:Bug family tripartite tricarboxylate transporter substrate binding protein [Auraticoccus monumenti]|uniref:Tripartite-type tricarboxylate transporter, receptor component TctC n=1 Tax=Auraticoccus monumenti TaxID=675864 RepID=A0A1G6Y3P5_9ACTN|nr:tripartite tricarboxylate transporter substrate binding protein [Auraticoccus monumenti]SDD85028.1 Tripartite-type tricarboxylate transporter, receptor component TctC [Auraticoccus monumenti]